MKSPLHSLLMLLALASASAFADDITWIDSSTISGLPDALTALKNTTSLPVLVPQKVPAGTYFVTIDGHNQGYNIYLDSTQDCHGAKYCNVLTLDAENFGYPQIYYDRNDQEVTSRVLLANNQPAYYTQGFAIADFWPPRISWRLPKKHTLYQISINTAKMTDAQVKTALITMANSVSN